MNIACGRDGALCILSVLHSPMGCCVQMGSPGVEDGKTGVDYTHIRACYYGFRSGSILFQIVYHHVFPVLQLEFSEEWRCLNATHPSHRWYGGYEERAVHPLPLY